jgi:hypothetical protein
MHSRLLPRDTWLGILVCLPGALACTLFLFLAYPPETIFAKPDGE